MRMPDGTTVSMMKNGDCWFGTAMAPGSATVDSRIGYLDEHTCLHDLIELVEAQIEANQVAKKDA